MLYVMRNLLIIVCTLAALYGVGTLIAEPPASTTRVAHVSSETTKTSETTSRYLARVAGEERDQAQQGAAWQATHRATTGQGCGGDAECARVHGLPEDAPITVDERVYEDSPEWDARTMGNGQAGVGSEHGPRGTTCPSGGTYLVNDLGYRVCQY